MTLNMSDHARDPAVDPELAADLRSDRVRYLKERIGQELERESEECVQAIKPAWEAMQAAFQKRKRIIFATLEDVEGLDRAREVIALGLDEISPPSFAVIASHFGSGPTKSITPAATPHTSPFFEPIPLFEKIGTATTGSSTPTRARPDPNPKPSGAPAGGGSSVTTTPRAPLTAKRSRIQPDISGPRKKAKANDASPGVRKETTRPRNPNFEGWEADEIEYWEVEGLDFVFEYPAAGPGWFVLRCDLGGDTTIMRFTTAPFECPSGPASSPAMEHFNLCKTCKGHDTTRQYQPDDIVKHNARRVTGDVDGTWVADANARLAMENAKKQQKRSSKQPEMVPATRSVGRGGSSSGTLLVS